MKSKYRKYDLYIRNEVERNLLVMRQQDLSLKVDRSRFNRDFILMKIRRYNINKAMKRLQMYKARNIEIDDMIERIIIEDYNKNV